VTGPGGNDASRADKASPLVKLFDQYAEAARPVDAAVIIDLGRQFASGSTGDDPGLGQPEGASATVVDPRP
jgi:hypothetical protein